MVIVLNGPLGIGKSTLAESLCEHLDSCVMLDGDALTVAHPPPPDELENLHATILLLLSHYRSRGYRRFVINHFWGSARALDDLRRRLARLDSGVEMRTFLLTLPVEENLRRIHQRDEARAVKELEFDLVTMRDERDALSQANAGELGEPFEVSGTPDELVNRLLGLLPPELR